MCFVINLINISIKSRLFGGKIFGSAINNNNTGYSVYQNDLEVLLKHCLLVPSLRVSEPVGIGWGRRICMPNKFPSDAFASDFGFTMRATGLEY